MVEILIQPNLKVIVSWYQKLYFWADIIKTENLHKIEIFSHVASVCLCSVAKHEEEWTNKH